MALVDKNTSAIYTQVNSKIEGKTKDFVFPNYLLKRDYFLQDGQSIKKLDKSANPESPTSPYTIRDSTDPAPKR